MRQTRAGPGVSEGEAARSPAILGSPRTPYINENTHIRVIHCHLAFLLDTTSANQNPDFPSLMYVPNYGRPLSSCPSAPSSTVPTALAPTSPCVTKSWFREGMSILSPVHRFPPCGSDCGGEDAWLARGEGSVFTAHRWWHAFLSLL